MRDHLAKSAVRCVLLENDDMSRLRLRSATKSDGRFVIGSSRNEPERGAMLVRPFRKSRDEGSDERTDSKDHRAIAVHEAMTEAHWEEDSLSAVGQSEPT